MTSQSLLEVVQSNETEEASPKKICIINTGGTIGMIYNKQNLLETKEDILRKNIFKLKELNHSNKPNKAYFKCHLGEFVYEIYDFKPLIDSSEMNIEHYIKIIDFIKQKYKKFSSFIILHGSDTLGYTASMLNLFIQNNSKPIFMIGSSYSIFSANPESDGFLNIRTSFEYASCVNTPNIYVSNSGMLFDSKNCKKFSSDKKNMFYYDKCLVSSTNQIDEKFKIVKSNKLNTIFIYPKPVQFVSLWILPYNTSFDHIKLIKEDVLLIFGYGNGNIPTSPSLIKLIKGHQNSSGLSIMVSQCPDGNVSPIYSSWTSLLSLGVIPIRDQTIEYITAKVSYLKSLEVPDYLMKFFIYIDLDYTYDSIATPKIEDQYLYNIIIALHQNEAIISEEQFLFDLENNSMYSFYKNPVKCYGFFQKYEPNSVEINSKLVTSLFEYLKMFYELKPI